MVFCSGFEETTVGLLNRNILLQVAVPSLLALAVISVVAVANEIQELVQDLPVAQVTLGDVSRLMVYFLPLLLSYVVPVTYMMGILLAFGRLSHNGEIVAMKAAGIPLKRVILPVIGLGGVLSVACYGVQDRVQPWAIGQVYKLVKNELPLRITLDALEPGVMHEFRGWRVYIGGRDAGTGTLRDVAILKPDEDSGDLVVYHADSAQLVTSEGVSRLEMHDGQYIPSADGDQVTPLTFAELSCDVPTLPNQRVPKTRQGMTVQQLVERQQALEEEYRTTPSELALGELRKTRQETADRLSLPFACLAVSFAAAPLGARAKRSGRSYTFAAGLAIVLSYYVLKLVMEPRSLHSLPVVMMRAWGPNVALCLVGMWLLWRVDRT